MSVRRICSNWDTGCRYGSPYFINASVRIEKGGQLLNNPIPRNQSRCILLPLEKMDETEYYAIAAGGIFILLLIVNAVSYMAWFIKLCSRLLRYLVPILVSGAWTPVQAIQHLIYSAVNALRGFRVSFGDASSARAGHSTLAKIPNSFRSYLSLVCKMLGISIPEYPIFLATSEAILFIISSLQIPVVKVDGPWQLVGPIVSCNSPTKVIFTDIAQGTLYIGSILHLLFRLPLSEVLLCCHQGMAIVLSYKRWRQVPTASNLVRLCFFISISTLVVSFAFDALAILYRSVMFHRGRVWSLWQRNDKTCLYCCQYLLGGGVSLARSALIIVWTTPCDLGSWTGSPHFALPGLWLLSVYEYKKTRFDIWWCACMIDWWMQAIYGC